MKIFKMKGMKIINKSQQKLITASSSQDHFDCIWTCGALYDSGSDAEYRCVARCARFL